MLVDNPVSCWDCLRRIVQYCVGKDPANTGAIPLAFVPCPSNSILFGLNRHTHRYTSSNNLHIKQLHLTSDTDKQTD